MKTLIFTGAIALLCLPIVAKSSWGPSGCAAPPAVAGIDWFPVQEPMRWVYRPDVPDQAFLYRGNVQIGGWDGAAQKYRPIINGAWGDPVDTAPIAPPTHLVRPSAEKLKAFQLNGVSPDKISKIEKHAFSGNIMYQGEGLPLVDDSKKLFLSVWSRDPAKRNAVLADMKKDPSFWHWAQERTHLWAGDAANPDHFLAKGRGGEQLYDVTNDPTIILQSPSGVELWRDAGYTQGPASLADLRKRDPDFRPDRTPGPGGLSANEANALLPLALLAGLVLILPRKENHDPD